MKNVHAVNNENPRINRFVPAPLWTGVLVFMVPALSLVTLFGVSLTSFLFVLALPLVWREGRRALARHWPEVRWVVLAFLFYFGLALACYALRPEQPLSTVEKPLRMFCAISAMMVVLAAAPSRRTLYWGLVAGALGACVLAGYQRLDLGLDRSSGLTNAVLFGDLALCLGLVALAGVIDAGQDKRLALWLAFGALAGMLASFMSGTRGVWTGLALAALLFMRHFLLLRSTRMRVLLLGCLALVVSLYFVPASGMQKRVAEGIDDVRAWSNGDKFTNVGIRLELWKAAGMLIAEHPLFGVDPVAAHKRMERLVAEGRLHPLVLPPPHLHSDPLQALVNGGVPGLLAWLAILAAPFAFFARQARRAAGHTQPQYALALGGMLVSLSYFGFGLSDTLFWSVKSSMFYALMVFILMGLCLNSKEESGN
jgi:O-antigen ligase